MILRALHNELFNVAGFADANLENTINRNIFGIAEDHSKLRDLTVLAG